MILYYIKQFPLPSCPDVVYKIVYLVVLLIYNIFLICVTTHLVVLLMYNMFSHLVLYLINHGHPQFTSSRIVDL